MKVVVGKYDAFSCPFLRGQDGEVSKTQFAQLTYQSRSGLSGTGFILVPNGAGLIEGYRVDAVPLRTLQAGEEFVAFTGHGSEPEHWQLVRRTDGGQPPEGWTRVVVEPPWWADHEIIEFDLLGEPPCGQAIRRYGRQVAWPLWVEAAKQGPFPQVRRGGLRVALEELEDLEPGELRMPFYRDPSGALWEVSRWDGKLQAPTIFLAPDRYFSPIHPQWDLQVTEKEAQALLPFIREWHLPWTVFQGSYWYFLPCKGPGKGPRLPS